MIERGFWWFYRVEDKLEFRVVRRGSFDGNVFFRVGILGNYSLEERVVRSRGSFFRFEFV